jgi:splicing factor 3B subunit 3
MVVAVAFHRHKGKFLYLVQTELGDLFELQFHFTHEDVHNISLQYFDSIPVASNLCFLRSGFLFAPSERGNHLLYQITSLGREE